jgi:hypothetical protein
MIPKRSAVRFSSRLMVVSLVGLALLLAACAGTPTPIFISEAEATQTALPPTATLAPSLPEARLQFGAVAIAGLNPLAIPDPATEAVQGLIYESLVGYDAAGELQPVLVVDLPASSEDGLTWTVDVRPDVSLHDGTVLDGALVVDALQACLDYPEWADASLALDALRTLVTEVADEDMRVVFHLRTPFDGFPALLADQSLAISNGPGIGTGPFVVTSSDASGLALDGFSSYHDGAPSLAGIDIRLFNEESDPAGALAEALSAGTLDIAIGDGLGVSAGFQAWPSSPQEILLLLNTQVPPFDRAAVREALRQVATPGAAAREALASAGLPDAFDLLVWSTQDPAVAEPLLAAAFDHLAANAELITVQPGEVIQLLAGGLVPSNEPSSEETPEPPAAFIVAGRPGWQQAWWLVLMQAPPEQAPGGESPILASGPAVSPTQALVRASVGGLAATSGGWPRVTARTVIAPDETS